MQKIRIIGCGQTLMGDDAVGCRVIQKLKYMDLPEHISIRDAGTPGLDLLNMMRPGERVIIIDAVITGEAEEGTILIFTEENIPKPSQMPSSVHQIALPEAIALGRQVQPEMMPDSIEIWGIEIKLPLVKTREMSEKITAAIDEVVRKIERELIAPSLSGSTNEIV